MGHIKKFTTQIYAVRIPASCGQCVVFKRQKLIMVSEGTLYWHLSDGPHPSVVIYV